MAKRVVHEDEQQERLGDRGRPDAHAGVVPAMRLDPFSPMNLFPDKFGIEASMTSFMDFYNYCRDTQFSGPEARSELNRGFKLKDVDARSLERMADAWDQERLGRETSWLPVPSGW